MLTAELSFRHYVPSSWFAFEHASLTFYGDIQITSLLDDLVSLIKYGKEKVYKEDMKKLKKLETETNDKIKDLEDAIEEIEEKHIFILYSRKSKKKLKELKSELSNLKDKSSIINKKIKEIEKTTKYSTITLERKFKELLAKLDFTCKAINKDESNRTIEKYESTLSKQDILNKIKTIEKEIRKEIELELRFEKMPNKDNNLEY